MMETVAKFCVTMLVLYIIVASVGILMGVFHV